MSSGGRDRFRSRLFRRNRPSTTKQARGPGVTVGRSGASFGVASYSHDDYWPLNTALYVIDFHGNDERFAYYFLKLFDFRSYNSGSAQPSLNRNFIHPVPVDIPPVDVQRAIARILGTLDVKIALNRRMNETLDRWLMQSSSRGSWNLPPCARRPKATTSALPSLSPTCSQIRSRTRSWGGFRRGG